MRGWRRPSRRSAGPSRAGRRRTPASSRATSSRQAPAAGTPADRDGRASSSASPSWRGRRGVRRRPCGPPGCRGARGRPASRCRAAPGRRTAVPVRGCGSGSAGRHPPRRSPYLREGASRRRAPAAPSCARPLLSLLLRTLSAAADAVSRALSAIDRAGGGRLGGDGVLGLLGRLLDLRVAHERAGAGGDLLVALAAGAGAEDVAGGAGGRRVSLLMGCSSVDRWSWVWGRVDRSARAAAQDDEAPTARATTAAATATTWRPAASRVGRWPALARSATLSWPGP